MTALNGEHGWYAYRGAESYLEVAPDDAQGQGQQHDPKIGKLEWYELVAVRVEMSVGLRAKGDQSG